MQYWIVIWIVQFSLNFFLWNFFWRIIYTAYVTKRYHILYKKLYQKHYRVSELKAFFIFKHIWNRFYITGYCHDSTSLGDVLKFFYWFVTYGWLSSATTIDQWELRCEILWCEIGRVRHVVIYCNWVVRNRFKSQKSFQTRMTGVWERH